MTCNPYKVLGYKGKQIRDNIHSADLVSAFYELFQAPCEAAVYNIDGGRNSNCSMLEAIEMCEEIAGRKLNWNYSDHNRIGDHIWWISDNSKFKSHFPNRRINYNVPVNLEEIKDAITTDNPRLNRFFAPDER